MERPIHAKTAPPFRSRTRISPPRLLPHDGDDHLPLARAVVEIAQHDLLPRPNGDLAARNRVASGRTDKRTAQVRIAILVAPSRIVSIVGIRGGDLIQGSLEVSYTAWFKFQRGNAQGRTDAGDIDDSGFNAAGGHNARHVPSYVDDVTAAAGREANLLLKDLHSSVTEFYLEGR